MIPHQAIILAAGQGRRLAPITDTLPKPLVPFFGRPLLDWALSAVLRAGVTRVAINAFHLADQIEARLDQLRPTLSTNSYRSPAPTRSATDLRQDELPLTDWPHIELHLSREPALLGTGGAVHHLRDWLTPDEPFFVVNADAVFAEPLTTLASGTAPALLVTREPAFRHERRLVAAADRLVALDESSPEGGYTFCGVTLADPELPRRLPAGPSCILRQGFLPYLDRLPVRLVETTDFFADTGTPELLVDAHRRGRSMTALGPPLR